MPDLLTGSPWAVPPNAHVHDLDLIDLMWRFSFTSGATVKEAPSVCAMLHTWSPTVSNAIPTMPRSLTNLRLATKISR